tara:strand:+ start:508 stop:684 length:177 start_codon:yes stop_codon:yes gene_type:complete
MRKFLYELGAAATIVFGMVPICIVAAVYAAYFAIVETAKIFPAQISALFEIWYLDKEQ